MFAACKLLLSSLLVIQTVETLFPFQEAKVVEAEKEVLRYYRHIVYETGPHT